MTKGHNKGINKVENSNENKAQGQDGHLKKSASKDSQNQGRSNKDKAGGKKGQNAV